MYRWRHFLAENAARALTIPDVPASDLPVLIHSRWNASCQALCGSVAVRCEPFSLNRLTPASRNSGSWPGTMAAGAQEQAASCDAFVLSRRPPAPGAPPSRTSPLCLIAKPFPEPSPNHGPVLGRDCRCEFRQARSRAPRPDSVLTVAGMTDGVWQGRSVMSTPRRGPCRASRHDRGRRETPRVPCLTLPTSPRSCLLSPERNLPRMALCGIRHRQV